jgi:hypothetical protein
MRTIAFAVTISVALAACSDSSESRPSGPPGCDQSAINGTCVARVGLTPADCTSGTFVQEGCPMSANWFGTCVDGSTGQMNYYYYVSYDFQYHNPYYEHVMCDGAGGTWLGSGAPTVSAWCRDLTSLGGVCIDMTGPEDEVAVLATDPLLMTCQSTGACPTDGRSGTCFVIHGGISKWVRYYDAATATADAASCTADGYTWTPG